jgi:gluconokinase
VIMGVAGCGKSTLGQAVAQRTGWPMIEGDDFHSPENKARMHAGIPLSDADRESWLRALAREIQQRKHGAVLACSALKRAYRDILRAASPGLLFVFLDITQEEALRRLRARGQHFFPPSLLQSQFETLEAPVDESDVLRLDASLPPQRLLDQTVQWLQENSGQTA